MINNADGKTLLRYDTLENWNRVNPVLAKGEFVIVIDNGKAFMKCGDGTKTFSALPYILGDNGEAKNVTWDEIIGKPTTFAPNEHNHDNLYYTESEIDTKLNNKQNVINDLETIRDGASKGATALQTHQDISGKADKSTTLAGYGITNAYTKTETDNKLSGKSDTGHTHSQYLTQHQDISGKADTSTSIRFLNQENYVGARFYNTDLAQKANEKYIEWWQTQGGWFNFKLGNLNAVGDISATGKIYSNSKEVLTVHQDISGKLDKTGGTLTGAITFSEQDAIKKHSNTGSLRIYGGNSTNSGAIILFGGDASSYGGASVIRAKDSSKFADIWLYSDGTTSAPTPATNDNSTKIATTSFVKAQGYITSSSISGKADKSTTLAGYGITNAYTKTEVDTKIASASGVTWDILYPVGYIFISTVNTSPQTIFGGTWVSIGNNLKISSTDYFWGGIQIYAWKRTA